MPQCIINSSQHATLYVGFHSTRLDQVISLVNTLYSTTQEELTEMTWCSEGNSSGTVSDSWSACFWSKVAHIISVALMQLQRHGFWGIWRNANFTHTHTHTHSHKAAIARLDHALVVVWTNEHSSAVKFVASFFFSEIQFSINKSIHPGFTG